jgi:hypothetical protein
LVSMKNSWNEQETKDWKYVLLHYNTRELEWTLPLTQESSSSNLQDIFWDKIWIRRYYFASYFESRK